jgi:hypothetical protein
MGNVEGAEESYVMHETLPVRYVRYTLGVYSWQGMLAGRDVYGCILTGRGVCVGEGCGTER